MRIEVVPYNPQWPDMFQAEAKQIAKVLGELLISIHHIGSTAIPGIYAKPIIDFLVIVQEISQVDAKNPQMEVLGYEALGEFGIPGRRYFRKDNMAGVRTHQIHAFASQPGEIERHLAFRDYMIAHPAEAKEYSELKQQLAKQFPYDIYGYMDGKDSFIKDRQAKALAWRQAQQEQQSH